MRNVALLTSGDRLDQQLPPDGQLDREVDGVGRRGQVGRPDGLAQGAFGGIAEAIADVGGGRDHEGGGRRRRRREAQHGGQRNPARHRHPGNVWRRRRSACERRVHGEPLQVRNAFRSGFRLGAARVRPIDVALRALVTRLQAADGLASGRSTNQPAGRR
jgi:hypothetical protein